MQLSVAAVQGHLVGSRRDARHHRRSAEQPHVAAGSDSPKSPSWISNRTRLAAIDEIVNWTNPGPGGFYDDLGELARQPHLVRGADYADDPAFLHSALVGFGGTALVSKIVLDLCGIAERRAAAMRYTDSIPPRNTRSAWSMLATVPRQKIRLVANGGIEIHPFIAKPTPFDRWNSMFRAKRRERASWIWHGLASPAWAATAAAVRFRKSG